MKTANGTSHAKIILMGEHSVVYGQPAVALPLPDLSMTVKIRKVTAGQWMQNKYFIGPIANMPNNLLGTQRLIQTILKHFGQEKAAFKIQIESNIPSEKGMGSSAATAIAVTRALFNYFDRPLSHDQLLKFSNVEEKITHGNPSGLDAATASAPRPVWFVPGKQLTTIPFNLNGFLVIADSGIKGRTDIAVNSVKQKLIHEPQVTKPKIERLGQLATNAKYDLTHDQIANLGKNMSQAQDQLAKLGVSNQALDNLTRVACQNGAAGAKLTGSGLGGCVIAVTRQSTTADHVVKSLSNHGAVATWIQRL